MPEKVYKKISVVGCSSDSIEKAIEHAVSKAATNLHGLAWFEMTELRGAIANGKPTEWQVTVDVAFKLD
jgi:flavin-binding protein dodecin